MADSAVPTTRNKDASWRDFSSDDYWSHNYKELQPEDRDILQAVSRFLVSAFRGRRPAARAIDVGSGTNLYPALLMLPWAEHLTLLDYSPGNVAWLREHVARAGRPWTWQPFWDELRELDGYNEVTDPRKQLREACTGPGGQPGIEQGSVFGLAEDPRRWQLGTMFFVAESITRDPVEFSDAVRAFLGALEPGAPFAAAFMENSAGYKVGEIDFPAVRVSCPDVEQVLRDGRATELSVARIKQPAVVRDGYTGMIVATGRAGGR